uniref:Zgc:153738 n=1 Tax=Latimeria chalumnae TaxID=7897 RepID=H3AKF9_LATCH
FVYRAYNKMWSEAHLTLNDLLAKEALLESAPPQKDRMIFYQTVATLYVRYIQIFRKLESAYDQLVHPQKRTVLRLVLDGVMGRILELKNEMVQCEFSEYHYVDDIVQDLKLTPEDIEIPIPKYFINEKMKILKEREMVLAQILKRLGTGEIESMLRPLRIKRKMTLDEAIRVIQVAERSRQGRLRAKFMKDIRRDDDKHRRAKEKERTAEDENQAAVIIQKVWKGYFQRKKTKREREEEMIFIGMIPADQVEPIPAVICAQENEEERRVRQEKYDMEYQQALLDVKAKMTQLEGADLREAMKDQIRQWFLECHDVTGRFPDYPSEEDGGSALIFAEKTPEQVTLNFYCAVHNYRKSCHPLHSNKCVQVRYKVRKKKKKKKSSGHFAVLQEEDPGLKMISSNFLPKILEGHTTYKSIWQNRDESQNFRQGHEIQLIKEEKQKELEAEIRFQVDVLMREELANLKLAVDRDAGGKKKKASKKKKKKKKKGKKDRKKKKKEKDLTPDRTIDSLYEELAEQGLLKQANKVQLSEYMGDYSYLGTTLRQTDIEPMPSLSDVRQVIALYGVLPLG